MKIHKLRFKNLNSLAGEWEVDFADPALSRGGLLAIVGPTGAGKTTILDAICLALYGHTPRLGAVTQERNEIMSRHTGECAAEVLFETQRGLFLAGFNQRRARKAPGGRLQQTARFLADQTSGTELARGVADTDRLMEKVTGLNFERFTRSVLLAQGAFAAFLEASPAERGPLLEQITGTDIYSRLSRRAHEEQAVAKQTLDRKRESSAAAAVLNEARRAEIAEELAAVKTAGERLAEEAAARRAQVERLEAVLALKNRLADLAGEEKKLAADRAAFAPEARRLLAAERAAEIAADYQALALKRQDALAARQRLAGAQEALPLLAEKTLAASRNQAAAASDLEKIKAAALELEPLLAEARQLEALWAGQHQAVQAARTAHDGEAAALAAVRLAETNLNQTLSKRQAALTKLERRENPADERLVSELAAIVADIDHLAELRAEAGRLWGRNQAAPELSLRACSENSLDQALASARQQRIEAETEARRLLNGRNPAEVRQEQNALEQKLKALEDRRELCRRLAAVEKNLGAAERRLGDLRAARAEAAGGLNILRLEKESAQADLEGRRRLHDLSLEIKSLEERRRQLADGQPCPLCGSLDHPYAHGRTPRLDEAAGRLKEAEERHEAVWRRTARLEADLAANGTETARLEEERQKLAQERTAQQEALAANGPADQDETLESAAAAAEAELAAGRRLVRRLESRETAVLRARLTEKEAALLKAVAPYGVREEIFQPDSDVPARLTKQRDQWLARRREADQLEKALRDLAGELKARAGEAAVRAAALADAEKKLAAAEQEERRLAGKRAGFFGGRSADQAAADQRFRREAAETALAEARRRHDELKAELEARSGQAAEMEAALAGRQAELETLAARFAAALAAQGLADEAGFLAARLSPAALSRLTERAQELSAAATALAARRQETEEALAARQAEGETLEPLPAARQTLQALTGELAGLERRRGALEHQLSADDQTRRNQAALLAEISTLETRLTRLAALDELIGSHDGKKFRTFAQGLTFENVLAQANRRLQELSDRYLLLHRPEEPLEIKVLDKYQAAEIRPVKTLSGGESFLVSLALALGLSDMASENVRLDSLFLDEGFGSLDEDSLETALTALANLHRDGKLIVLISHVPALKARLAAGIELVPETNGRSSLRIR